MTSIKAFVPILSLVLFLNSCTSRSDENKNIPKEPANEVYTVEIKDMKFVPDEITAKKGDRVVFVNRDLVAHCVTEEKTKAWTSSILPPGEAFLLMVKESSNYYCAIHLVMKGRIIMK